VFKIKINKVEKKKKFSLKILYLFSKPESQNIYDLTPPNSLKVNLNKRKFQFNQISLNEINGCHLEDKNSKSIKIDDNGYIQEPLPNNTTTTNASTTLTNNNTNNNSTGEFSEYILPHTTSSSAETSTQKCLKAHSQSNSESQNRHHMKSTNGFKKLVPPSRLVLDGEAGLVDESSQQQPPPQQQQHKSKSITNSSENSLNQQSSNYFCNNGIDKPLPPVKQKIINKSTRCNFQLSSSPVNKITLKRI
jgi:hypothetical protein